MKKDQSIYGEQTTAAAERGQRKRQNVDYTEEPSVFDDVLFKPPRKKRCKLIAKTQSKSEGSTDNKVAPAQISSTFGPIRTSNTRAKPKKRPQNSFKATEPKDEAQAEADSVFGAVQTPGHLANRFAYVLESYLIMLRSKAKSQRWHDIFKTSIQSVAGALEELEEIAMTNEAPRPAPVSNTHIMPRGARGRIDGN